jgi:uncharacterized protein
MAYSTFKLCDELLLIQGDFISKHLEVLTKILHEKIIWTAHNSKDYIFDMLEKNIPTNIFDELFTKFIKSKEIQLYMKNKKLSIQNTNSVIYHNNCPDGFGSAFIIWHYLKLHNIQLNNIVFTNRNYLIETQQLSPDFLDKYNRKNLVICDFSYRPSQLFKLICKCKSILILDHHKTAKFDLINIPDELKIFDMKLSGVGIVWNVYFPDKPLPKFLTYIQDRDLWKFEIENTTEFSVYLAEQDFNFELWESYLDESNLNKVTLIGKSWLEYQNIIIDNLIAGASYFIQKINNRLQIVLYVNSSIFKSEVGNKLLKKFPYADFSVILNYNAYRDQTYISLRSTDDRADVSIIAKQLGGGGHRNSAGLALKGNHGILPFEKAEEYGILNLLQTGIQDDAVFDGKKIEYVLFKVDKIDTHWLEMDYLNIMKKYFITKEFLIFQTPSDFVHINPENNIATPEKLYTIIYNEKSNHDQLAQLVHEALQTSDNVLLFESELEIKDILLKLFKIPDDKIVYIDEMTNPSEYQELRSTKTNNDDSSNESLEDDLPSDNIDDIVVDLKKLNTEDTINEEIIIKKTVVEKKGKLYVFLIPTCLFSQKTEKGLRSIESNYPNIEFVYIYNNATDEESKFLMKKHCVPYMPYILLEIIDDNLSSGLLYHYKKVCSDTEWVVDFLAKHTK